MPDYTRRFAKAGRRPRQGYLLKMIKIQYCNS